MNRHIIRGGGGFNEIRYPRSAFRFWNYADEANSDQGFRLVRLPEEGGLRVGCGGSWATTSRDVRAAFRCWYIPNAANNFVGFRLIRRTL